MTLLQRWALGAAVVCAVLLSPQEPSASEFVQCGKASWYKLRGKTASGEPADPQGLTAAHRKLPFGTLATVTNLANGRSVTVRINDRGPFAKGRVIDVTQAAAVKLGFVQQGITRVKVVADTPKSSETSRQNCQ
ncbi:septal ring lytic transglycosylase RlpA family protein [Labrenzia sp. PHM005]|uniref:septal ring lytic transglycosylase RlpA family protein n=1 Tax=Labrenzia sp. PHM005 TaxID=2590016 RepID=UPI00113FE205|nr:septal ring lytic transglycosylase RlpA family protein [Labrenzia sp. PHM005]QDG79422.1 septal ring lytic transglycosylase RlpA family protein [Labrenzia sp. PHM005]